VENDERIVTVGEHAVVLFCCRSVNWRNTYPQGITSLRSIDLHPSSWISVAWYEAWHMHNASFCFQRPPCSSDRTCVPSKCSAHGWCLLLGRYPLYMIPSSLSLKELSCFIPHLPRPLHAAAKPSRFLLTVSGQILRLRRECFLIQAPTRGKRG